MASSPLRLQTREARRKLAVREEPYWFEVRRGLSIGYRRGSDGGSWLLREFKPDSGHKRGGRYVKRRLGVADDTVPADGTSILSWHDAQKLALDNERPTITRPGKLTVQAAYEAYAASRATPIDPRERAMWAKFMEPSLGSKQVADLTKQDIERWRNQQVTSHGRRGQSTEGADDKDLLRRARYTANRRFNLLRAVLNHAFESHDGLSDSAWRRVSPFQRVDRPRTVTVSIEQARVLLTKLQEPLLGIATAALYSGLRLGELLGLRNDDFDAKGSRLRVRHSKSGAERFVPLSREGTAFFAKRVDGRAASEPVFERMRYMDVSRGMRAASDAAGISPRVTMHDLRRSYGSLMLDSGAPIEVIQHVLGHADMRMTKRTYAHLQQQTVAKAVQKHLPSFNDTQPKPKRTRKRPAATG